MTRSQEQGMTRTIPLEVLSSDNRRVRLSFSSEYPVRRYDWVNDEYYDEVLGHREEEVDLYRLRELGVVLFNHNTDKVVGKIAEVGIENGRGVATIEFDDDQFSKDIEGKVKNGTLKGVSMGYRIEKTERTQHGRRATKWYPYEISVVSVPADPTVGINRRLDVMDLEALLNEERELSGIQSLTEEQKRRLQEVRNKIRELQEGEGNRTLLDGGTHTVTASNREDDPLNEPVVGTGIEDVQRAIREERERARNIRGLCQQFDIDPQTFIDAGNTMDEVRTAVLGQLSARTSTRGDSRFYSGDFEVTDQRENMVRAMSDACLMRGGIAVENDKQRREAEQFTGMTLRDMAIYSLEKDGESNARMMNPDEMFSHLTRQFFNPEASFPSILDKTVKKAYVAGYQEYDNSYEAFCSFGSLPNFKATDSMYVQGSFDLFEEVPEGGELKHGTTEDFKRPTRQLKTFGRQFTLSRKAFIDDDIGLVTSMPKRWAKAKERTVEQQVFYTLLSNPVIYDGNPLFCKEHNNIMKTAATISGNSVKGMIIKIGDAVDDEGRPIVVKPSGMIVPLGCAFDFQTIFLSQTINTPENTQAANPLYNYPLKIVETPYINYAGGKTDPYFMYSKDVPGIHIDYLNGQKMATVRKSEKAGQLGFIWDIYCDWGITVLDYRGLVKNDGVKVSLDL